MAVVIWILPDGIKEPFAMITPIIEFISNHPYLTVSTLLEGVVLFCINFKRSFNAALLGITVVEADEARRARRKQPEAADWHISRFRRR